jgi:hypothetical protein
VAVATLGALSGCFEDFPEGRLSVSLESGQLLIANCGTNVVAPFKLTIDKSTDEFSNVFTASSDSPWKVGEIVSTDPDSWAEVKHPDQSNLVPGDRVFVRYFSGDVAAVSKYIVPEAGLQEGQWLHFDGSVSPRACSAQPKQ